MSVIFFAMEGECDWLVQTAQEHRAADELQREARPWQAENRPVQPTHDLCAADAQQGHNIGLNSKDGVRCLHLSQQVSGSAHFLVFFLLAYQRIKQSFITAICCVRSLWRLFLKVPVLVNNLGLLEQLAYWKVASPCSAAGYNLTMKKHRYKPTRE